MSSHVVRGKKETYDEMIDRQYALLLKTLKKKDIVHICYWYYLTREYDRKSRNEKWDHRKSLHNLLYELEQLFKSGQNDGLGSET